MTKVKICGITNLEDARLSIRYGADQLGFNFYEKSPRYVAAETAKSMVDELPADITKVGVFVNETIGKICETAMATGLDVIQLHGDENSDFIAKVRAISGLTVLKALRVTPEFRVEDAVETNADGILLDSHSPKERGGTGETFDWEIAQKVSAVVPVLYLAGGLTPENVGDAIRMVRPYAVDVCSRIESEPGKKDPDKLKAFIAAVKPGLRNRIFV